MRATCLIEPFKNATTPSLLIPDRPSPLAMPDVSKADPYAKPPKHLRDAFLRKHWNSLSYQTRKEQHEKDDSSPTEPETQMPSVLKAASKRKMPSESESDSATLARKTKKGVLFNAKNICKYYCQIIINNIYLLSQSRRTWGTGCRHY